MKFDFKILIPLTSMILGIVGYISVLFGSSDIAFGSLGCLFMAVLIVGVLKIWGR